MHSGLVRALAMAGLDRAIHTGSLDARLKALHDAANLK